VGSPVLAKDPEPPQNGLLWETIASLQEQIETGLTALAQQLNEGLEALQGRIDGIQAYLDEFEETDPVFSEMDTEAELETQVGDNILTEGENISLLNNDAGYLSALPSNVMEEGESVSLLNNDAGYITEDDIPDVGWNEISGIPSGFADGIDNVGLERGDITTRLFMERRIVDGLHTSNFVFEYGVDPSDFGDKIPISASGMIIDEDADYARLEAEDYRLYPYIEFVDGHYIVTFRCRVSNPHILFRVYRFNFRVVCIE